MRCTLQQQPPFRRRRDAALRPTREVPSASDAAASRDDDGTHSGHSCRTGATRGEPAPITRGPLRNARCGRGRQGPVPLAASGPTPAAACHSVRTTWRAPARAQCPAAQRDATQAHARTLVAPSRRAHTDDDAVVTHARRARRSGTSRCVGKNADAAGGGEHATRARVRAVRVPRSHFPAAPPAASSAWRALCRGPRRRRRSSTPCRD